VNDKTRWKRFLLIVKVIEVRLRFIAVLLATALVIGYWDTVTNYWERWTRPAAAAAQSDPEHEYYCPMHPKVVRAGLDPNGEVPKCPICGMPMSKRPKGEAEPQPEGVASRVQLSPDRVRLAGIQTAEVAYRPMVKELTTVGEVTFDESRLSRVTSRVNGYVERLLVDKTYTIVKQGDPLAEIYSPELYSAAQELLLAIGQPGPGDLIAGPRRRLALLGISDREIDDILASRKAIPRLTVRSPQNGYVIGKPIVNGSRVDEGMTLLEVADLSVVWIEADVFEKDIALLRPGQAAEATVEAMPGRQFAAKVALIYPRVETGTRTNRVRFEVANPQLELSPGMYATVRIRVALRDTEPFRAQGSHAVFRPVSNSPGTVPTDEVLTVPERAVIDTGTKQIVYVERKPGVFEGVEVKLGPRVGDYYPVVNGLTPGDRIAAAGAFLVDAETRLNPAAASTYFGASGTPQSAGHSHGSAPQPAAKPQRKPSTDELKNLAQLSPEDRAMAEAQGVCPITKLPLGSMGEPVKITLDGRPVFLCCSGCVSKANKDPARTLKASPAKASGGREPPVNSTPRQPLSHDEPVMEYLPAE
jgi:Cu(I)/Ag(I) efflux system membrane fusion protein